MNGNLLLFMLKNALDESKEFVKHNTQKVIFFENKMALYSRFATVPITVRVDE